MAEIQLHNTLGGKIEPFVPQKAGEVRMYSCGPTVYDYAHIGNFRTFVFQDILRRFLKSRGYKITQVMNLTDVDDRIIANAAAAHVSIRDYTEKFAQAFFDDCKTLSLESPEHWMRATDNIDAMVQLIERLREKSFTYESDGSIYYRIAKFPDYGKLSNIDVAGIQTGVRVDVDRYEKESARDFALWKAPKEGEHFWETSIGRGRPGWHIECSAMAMKYLGETLDIHTGGIDLAFPHHENEIAQSEARHRQALRPILAARRASAGRRRENVQVAGQLLYLARSFREGLQALGVAICTRQRPVSPPVEFHLRWPATSRQLRRAPAGISPTAWRRVSFPWHAEKYGRSHRRGSRLNSTPASPTTSTPRAPSEPCSNLCAKPTSPWTRASSVRPTPPRRKICCKTFDKVFAVLENNDAQKLQALGYAQESPASGDAEVEKLVAERQAARQSRDFATADRIRKELDKRGIILEDSRDGGVRWKRK